MDLWKDKKQPQLAIGIRKHQSVKSECETIIFGFIFEVPIESYI